MFLLKILHIKNELQPGLRFQTGLRIVVRE